MFITMILIGSVIFGVLLSKTAMSKMLMSSMITTLCYLGVIAFIAVSFVNAFRNKTTRA